MSLPSGLLAAAAISVGTPLNASETITYTYDAMGRMVKVARLGTVNSGTSECYSYDPASNRSNVTVATSGDCSGGGLQLSAEPSVDEPLSDPPADGGDPPLTDTTEPLTDTTEPPPLEETEVPPPEESA